MKSVLILSDIHVGHRLAVAPLTFTDSQDAMKTLAEAKPPKVRV